MMFEIMVSEKSYDALPNFTAADCKGFREREGRREGRKEGREEGGRGEGGTGYITEVQLCFQVCG